MNVTLSWLLQSRSLTPLEPYDWKLSRTVLRGERGSNAPDLPGLIAKVNNDGQVDEAEKALLRAIKAQAKSFPAGLEALL